MQSVYHKSRKPVSLIQNKQTAELLSLPAFEPNRKWYLLKKMATGGENVPATQERLAGRG